MADINPPTNPPQNSGINPELMRSLETYHETRLTPENVNLNVNNAFDSEQHSSDINLSNRDYLYEGANPYLDQFANPNAEDPFAEVRAHAQGNIDKATKGVGRALLKAGTEIAKMPGTIAGIAASPFADENKGFETAFNNDWHKAINQFSDKINQDVLPVYVKQAVQGGDLWDNLKSVDFWATEGADGIGFIASMFAPGAALKALGVASEASSAATAMASRVAKAQKLLGMAPTSLTEVGITTANTLFEAGSEAGSAMDNMDKNKDKIISSYLSKNQGMTTEQATKMFDEQKGRLGRDMFLTNMAILAGPNFINTKMLNLAGANKVGQFIANGVDEVASPSFLSRIGKNVLKPVATNLASEGFFEEGLQTTAENYFKKGAEAGTLSKKSVLHDINVSEIANEYLDMIGTTEGQKAIALGGILGGGMTSFHNITSGQESKDIATTNSLLAAGKAAVHDYLSTTVDPDIYVRSDKTDTTTGEKEFALDDNGKKVVDPVKMQTLILKNVGSENASKAFDIAKQVGNDTMLSMLQSQAEDNMILPFVKDQENGIPALKAFLNSNENIDKKAADRIVKKAEVLQKVNNDYNNFSKPILNLRNDQSTQDDVVSFHDMMRNTNYANKSQQIKLQDHLNIVNDQLRQLISDKGIMNMSSDETDYGISGRHQQELLSKDSRFENLHNTKLELNRQLDATKQLEEDIWNKKTQQGAFDEFVKERRDIEAANSEDNVTAATNIMTDVSTASTPEEVDNALNGTTTETTTNVDKNSNVTTTTATPTTKPIDTVDPKTGAVIKKKAQDKKDEIADKKAETIKEKNDETETEFNQDVENAIADLLNFQDVSVGEDIYSYLDGGNEHSLIKNNTDVIYTMPTQEALVQAFKENILKSKPDSLDTIEKPSDQFEPSDTLDPEDNPEANDIITQTNTDFTTSDSNTTFPTIALTGVYRDGNFPTWLSNRFKNWLYSSTNKKGQSVSFAKPSGKLSVESQDALNRLESGDLSDKEFLHRYLPIQVNISNQEDVFTFITTLGKDNSGNYAVPTSSKEYEARANIVDAIIANNGYKGLSTTINYQKGGQLDYIKPGEPYTDENGNIHTPLVQNNIAQLDQFNNDPTKVPLFFVMNETGKVHTEKDHEFPMFPIYNLGPQQKGYVYTIIGSHNGAMVPVKLNVRKFNREYAEGIYSIYKSMYDYVGKHKGNQHTIKLSDLVKEDANIKTVLDTVFKDEISLFHDGINVNVSNFMTLLMHDNVQLDGSFKPYTTKYIGGSISFGMDAFVNFKFENENFKNAFVNFMTNQKRQNVKLHYLSGNTIVDHSKYKSYLMNNGVLSVNLNPAAPFKGDINVYIDSKVEGVKPQEKDSLKEISNEQYVDIETKKVLTAKKGDIVYDIKGHSYIVNHIDKYGRPIDITDELFGGKLTVDNAYTVNPKTFLKSTQESTEKIAEKPLIEDKKELPLPSKPGGIKFKGGTMTKRGSDLKNNPQKKC